MNGALDFHSMPVSYWDMFELPLGNFLFPQVIFLA
jgi:hypothetical protein